MKGKTNNGLQNTDSLPNPELNALLDCIIIDLLKKNPEGLCRKEINDRLEEYQELKKRNYRTRIDTRLEYLIALGKRSGLFEIRSKLEEKKIQKGKKRCFSISTRCLMPKYSLCSSLTAP